jgi:hypothetical protein
MLKLSIEEIEFTFTEENEWYPESSKKILNPISIKLY